MKGPKDFEVRRSRSSDLAALDTLFAASYPKLLKADYPPSVLVTALPLISRAQPGLLTSPTYFVAEDQEGRIIGAGGWTKARPQGGRRRGVGHVRHVVTDHRCLRNGVARGIMEQIIDTAQGLGIGRLDCQSTRTAVPFYTACGFQALGEIEVTLRPGIAFPAVAMARNL